MLGSDGRNAFGQEEAGLLFIPGLEKLWRFWQAGFCQPENGAVKRQGGTASREDGKRVSLPEVEEGLAVEVVMDGDGRRSLQPGEGFCDPIGVAVNEGLDARGGEAHWGAHGQAAVAFDDDGDRFAMGANEIINGDGHAGIVTERLSANAITYKLRIFRLCQGQFWLFFKQISANFAEDASQIYVATGDFMAKVGVTSMFGAFRYKEYHLDRNSDCLTCN
jgi:hypothetical protein